MNLWKGSFELMTMGMGTVFIFLILLIVVMVIMSIIANKLVEVEHDIVESKDSSDKEIAAAIAVAYFIHKRS